MKIKEIVQTTPNFQVLSEDEIERIYFDALGIIESVGARVKNARALELFSRSEAVVTDTDRVRIPTVLVEKALREHPAKIALAGRNRKRSVRLQKDELAFGTGPIYPLAPKLAEKAGWETPYESIFKTACLADYLENLDFITGPLAFPSGNEHSWIFSQAVAMLEGSGKPFLLGAPGSNELYRLWQMAKLVCGGEKEFRLSPLFALYVEIDSPLTLTAGEAEKLLFCAEKRIPCVCASRAISGVTAPSTIAGMLVLALAETMLVSVLSYLKNPGMALIRGGITSVPPPSGHGCAFGAPEMALSTAANTDISKWLGLGMLFPAGIADEEKMGQDAGAAAATSLYCAFLSGADLIWGAGLIHSGQGMSPDCLVMCNEIIGMIKQIGKGICTEEEYLAMDLIESVGPGGEYLTQDHTFTHWKEWFRPRLINRSTYETWTAAGKTTLKQRAEEERARILEEYTPAPMDPKLLEELRALAARQ